MKRRLRFTRKAETDLEGIGDYLADHNPELALRFVAQLRQRCTEIADFPESARLRPDIAFDVRVAVHARYLILYAVRDDSVVVERIIHGARDIADAL